MILYIEGTKLRSDWKFILSTRTVQLWNRPRHDIHQRHFLLTSNFHHSICKTRINAHISRWAEYEDFQFATVALYDPLNNMFSQDGARWNFAILKKFSTRVWIEILRLIKLWPPMDRFPLELHQVNKYDLVYPYFSDLQLSSTFEWTQLVTKCTPKLILIHTRWNRLCRIKIGGSPFQYLGERSVQVI